MNIDKVIEIGVQAGIKEALNRIEKMNEEKVKYRYDKTLRNTKFLLRNYNNFVEHCNNSNIASKQLKNSNSKDLLDEFEFIGEKELNMDSIQRGRDRTYIIVQQISTALEFFKSRSEKEKDENSIRRFRAIELVFIERMTYEETAEYLRVSEKTVTRDIKQAIEEISTIIFGIDAVRLEA